MSGWQRAGPRAHLLQRDNRLRCDDTCAAFNLHWRITSLLLCQKISQPVKLIYSLCDRITIDLCREEVNTPALKIQKKTILCDDLFPSFFVIHQLVSFRAFSVLNILPVLYTPFSRATITNAPRSASNQWHLWSVKNHRSFPRDVRSGVRVLPCWSDPPPPHRSSLHRLAIRHLVVSVDRRCCLATMRGGINTSLVWAEKWPRQYLTKVFWWMPFVWNNSRLSLSARLPFETHQTYNHCKSSVSTQPLTPYYDILMKCMCLFVCVLQVPTFCCRGESTRMRRE